MSKETKKGLMMLAAFLASMLAGVGAAEALDNKNIIYKGLVYISSFSFIAAFYFLAVKPLARAIEEWRHRRHRPE